MSMILTVDEFIGSSNGQDWANLVPGNTDVNVQRAELARKIRAATGWMEDTTNTPLIAAQHVELFHQGVRRDGALSLPARNAHLNQLISVAAGADASNLAVVSTTGAYIMERNWVVPNGYLPSGPQIQLGGLRRGPMLVKLVHVTGWPNTTLAGGALAGATTITVADGTGFLPALGSVVAEEPVRIVDGTLTETVVVTAVAGNVLTLAAGLVNAHASGIAVSAMPDDIKEAGMMATAAFLRMRSSDAMVIAQSVQGGPPAGADSQRWKLLRDAADILNNYARVR